MSRNSLKTRARFSLPRALKYQSSHVYFCVCFKPKKAHDLWEALFGLPLFRALSEGTWSEEKMPCSTHLRAPSITGTASSSTRAATPDPPDPEALRISARWPSRPKPVTSVHALAPYERHTSDVLNKMKIVPQTATRAP